MAKKVAGLESLEELIDSIGRCREQKKEAEDKEARLKPLLEKHELSVGAYQGKEYFLNVSEKVALNYSVEKAYKKLGLAAFLQCVKMVVGSLKEKLSLTELDELAEGKPNVSKNYSFSRIKRG